MEPIVFEKVQEAINAYANQDVYLHLETTNGAYATHHNGATYSAGAYIRNAFIQYKIGKIVGSGPYRVGLKLDIGWVYAEGITHYEIDDQNRLLLAGHDPNGRLAVALQISPKPF